LSKVTTEIINGNIFCYLSSFWELRALSTD